MDLSYSDEQRLLAEAALRFALQRGAFGQKSSHEELGEATRRCWKEIAELGWLRLTGPETYGGLDLGAIEVGIVAEAMGRGHLLEPFLGVASAVLLISKVGTEEQKAALLPSIFAGSSIAVIADSERHTYTNLHCEGRTTAQECADGWVVCGEKTHVIAGPWGDIFLVSANVPHNAEPARRLAVFAVPAKAPGVHHAEIPTVDGSPLGRLVLDNVRLPHDAMLGNGADAAGAIECIVDFMIAGLASEAAGCADALLRQTVDYTKSRIQFGKSLSSHQVIRHRIAEMSICLEEMRASALNAALFANAPADLRSRAASGAKAKAAACGRYIAEQSVQLHGGMGVTDELSIGAYFKRLLAIEFLHGDEQFHLHRYAALTLHATEQSERA